MTLFVRKQPYIEIGAVASDAHRGQLLGGGLVLLLITSGYRVIILTHTIHECMEKG